MNVEPTFWESLGRVLLLLDYNTRLVVLSAALLGVASGLVGSFLLLRKRSLMGDVLSHAALPGLAGMFLLLVALGMTGKELPLLLLGATIAGFAGLLVVQWLREFPVIKDDTAMGLVLSVFFGAGVALLGIVQQIPAGSAAGLESFIYGKTASIIMSDFLTLAGVAIVATVVTLLFFKELRLLCFDQGYAAAQGWPVRWLDILLLLLATAVTVAGLQAVGLILIIAFLITPAAAARFWTERLPVMLLLAAIIGGVSGWAGASLSALFPRLPAGAVIVLAATALFALSLIFGSKRGLLVRLHRFLNLRARMNRQHLLRALFELREASMEGVMPTEPEPWLPYSALRRKRSWRPTEVDRLARQAERAGYLETDAGADAFRLTPEGFAEAARTTRNHRLWELYLIRHAEIAPSHVDRDADTVEHILGAEMIQRLEELLPEYVRNGPEGIPASPHRLG